MDVGYHFGRMDESEFFVERLDGKESSFPEGRGNDDRFRSEPLDCFDMAYGIVSIA